MKTWSKKKPLTRCVCRSGQDAVERSFSLISMLNVFEPMPDTLDLAERGRLGINHFTLIQDQNCTYRMLITIQGQLENRGKESTLSFHDFCQEQLTEPTRAQLKTTPMTDTHTAYTPDELLKSIEKLPRFPLAHLPTPLEYLPRFSEALGGPHVWIKRDDCTGLAFGGNKARHNEFLIADALQQGANTVVWGAGVQSNNCRQTAAACAKAGLACHLVLGRGKAADGPNPVQGNLLLDHLVGASIEIVDQAEGPEVTAKIAQAADRLRGQGFQVYEQDPQHVKPLAALSYVAATIELLEQTAKAGITPDALYVCSAGATGAGIRLATAALGHTFLVQHITPIVWPWDTQATMTQIANDAAQRLGITTRLEKSDIHVTEEYVGEGYGIPTEGCLEAITLLARTEGIFVDPSYSGKSLAGLIDHIRSSHFTSNQNVVFIHTGGTPALFAYNEQLASDIERRSL